MKKIKYLFLTFILSIFLVPSICNAENYNSAVVDNIKVDIQSNGNDKKLTISFKLLKDIDVSKNDDIGIFYTTDNLIQYGYYNVNFYQYDNKIRNDGLTLAKNGSCNDTEKITGTKINKDSIVCFTKDLRNNERIGFNYSNSSGSSGKIINLDYTFENGTKTERINYNLDNSEILDLNTQNNTFGSIFTKAIERHYNYYVQSRAGGTSADGEYNMFTFYPDHYDNYIIATELGTINWDSNKNLEEYIKMIDEMISKANINFSVQSVKEKNNVSQDLLGGIKTSKKRVEFETKLNNKTVYIWNFDGSKMDKTDYNIDMSLNVGKSTNQSKIENLVNNKEESLVLEFGYHGELPKGTSVKVNVSDKYKESDILSLYYYNDKGELELTAKNIKVENGFATLNLEHCSEYVLVKEDNTLITPTEQSNNAQTSSMNFVLYYILVLGSLFGIIYVVRKKEIA